MPYIKMERRVEMLDVDSGLAQTAGELNYLITCLLIDYWRRPGANYQRINDIIGACEGAKAEFQRRVVGKYEDQKILENGDVYP